MAFVLGLLTLGAAWWWLARLKRADIAACRVVLDLVPAPGHTRRGATPEGFASFERALLQGTLHGHPATLLSRTVRHPRAAKLRRTGSEFTVLELALPTAANSSLRLQPAGVLGVVEHLVGRSDARRVAVDPVFDDAYVVYADREDWARAVLSPALREALLALRARTADWSPASAAGRLASGFTVGTFVITGSTAQYAVFGSPTRTTAEHVKAAVPLLIELANAASR